MPHSGGITVLHKLCHLLNENGYDAYLSPSTAFGLGHDDMSKPFFTSPRYNTKIVTEDILSNIDETIVIYPEAWIGNYLYAKNVVRWILAPPYPNKVITWSQSDLWFWYSDLYRTTSLNYGGYKKNPENNLYVSEFYTDIFKDNFVDRDINSWTLRKSFGKVGESDFIHEHDSVFIPYEDGGRFDWLAEVFNRSNRFYSYDPYTFLNVQAVMCGADSVVVPVKNVSLDDFIKYGFLSKHIAYGVDDIPRARKARENLQNDIDMMEQKSFRELHIFVEKCNEYFENR